MHFPLATPAPLWGFIITKQNLTVDLGSLNSALLFGAVLKTRGLYPHLTVTFFIPSYKNSQDFFILY